MKVRTNVKAGGIATNHMIPKMIAERWKRRIAAMIGLFAFSTALGLPSAYAAPVAPVQVPLQGEFLDLDAKPVINWSVPSRYAASQ